ncbi:MAG: methionyl-tRNA formyltransferase [Gammaproteobacteria bacterium]|nr:MAG: methionyl-tRNA formyltransferase [Gammaproteobacteria bacterium]UCH40464.1 MAG: methionyl-tRNA formyltransferase [Gammaproteobacteria bacterium]
MRLIVHGQQAYGKAVLEAILDKGVDEVVAVYCAPDKEGRPLDPLKEFALERNLPVYQPDSYKNPEVWEQLASHQADLCVMAYVLLFVPEEALNVPKYGSIQYHPSLLPWHKGPSSINWPIIMGREKTGLSIFWPDNGLDTGPILLQKEVEIGPDDTLGSVYFDKLFPLGVEAMLEAIELVRDGNAPKQVQDPDDGSYEGWCRKDDVLIDWSLSADQVYNLIRGANPQPGAWTTFNGAELKIFDSRKADASGEPGEVLSIDDSGAVIATGDGSIRVMKVRADAGKLAAADYAAEAGLEVGAKLGT